MSINLKIFLLILLLLQLLLIVRTVKRKKLTMKYASFWLSLIILMSIVVIFPNLLFMISKFAGFEKTSNMIFLIGFFFLFYISFIITTTTSMQNEKIKNLIQELSILKMENEKKMKEDKNYERKK